MKIFRSSLVTMTAIVTILGPLGLSKANAQAKKAYRNLSMPAPQPRPVPVNIPLVSIPRVAPPNIINVQPSGWVPGVYSPRVPQTFRVYSRTDPYDSWTYQGTYRSLAEATQVANDLQVVFEYDVWIR